jgi:hypothetical protein
LAIYLPTYVQHAYGVSLGGLAAVLALVALGNLVGNRSVAASRIAHVPKDACLRSLGVDRRLCAAHVSVAAGIGGLGRVGFRPYLRERRGVLADGDIGEMPSELRGALFGLNITMASMGWLLAGSLGGWLIAIGGFAGWAHSAVAAVLGTVLALASVPAPARPQTV